MKVCILMGSPRKEGNTASLLAPFIDELKSKGCECKTVYLYDKNLKPCIACRCCQQDWSIFGCSQNDDMQEIFDLIMKSELIVFATPIYSWYCTPPVKMVLDRMVYGMNKFYGEEKGPALWAGKSLASFVTCGYRPENGADLWETGLKRYCKHSSLKYLGMVAERHMGYNREFMDEKKAEHAREFAKEIYIKAKGSE